MRIKLQVPVDPRGGSVGAQLAQLKGDVKIDLMFHATDVEAMKKVDSQTVAVAAYASPGLHYAAPVMFDFFHTAIANVTISSCLVGFFIGGHPALRLRGRKRTGSLSQFKRRHSFSAGSSSNAGGGGGGGVAAPKRWWKGSSSAASAYELDIPSPANTASGTAAADDGAGAAADAAASSSASSATLPQPVASYTATSRSSAAASGGKYQPQQTLEGLYRVLLEAGEGLRSACESAGLDRPAERVRDVVQDIQLGWRAAQARMAADGFGQDCTMEANRCLTVWSQQLSLAWADCRGELLFNRIVFDTLATKHYSALHSRLLEGSFVSDQRLDLLVGLGEQRQKVLTRATQIARDLGAGGSPVRVLSERFSAAWKSRPIVIEDRYLLLDAAPNAGQYCGVVGGGAGAGGGRISNPVQNNNNTTSSRPANESSDFDSIAPGPAGPAGPARPAAATTGASSGGGPAAAYGGSAADIASVGVEGATETAAAPAAMPTTAGTSAGSRASSPLSSIPVKFKSTGCAASDALLADMLQDSDLRVCGNQRQARASTVHNNKKKLLGLHHDDYSDEGSDGDGTGHLVVCVHGLAGNQYDLRMLRLALLRFMPQMEFMMSAANESNTHRSFDEMTDGFVKELIAALDSPHVTRVSFIGHSLGNIIVRNALSRPSVQALFEAHNPTAAPNTTTAGHRRARPTLHTFLSLCGPHLGARYTTGIVSTGMWFMSKWKRSSSLDQLSMSDASDPRETFMFKLSAQPGFQFFKHVLLVSSPQDRYVPVSAALLHTCHKAESERIMSPVYKEMVQNLLGPLIANPETTVSRIYVMLPSGTRTLNSLIGRTGHIAVLDDDAAVEQLNVSILKYFR